MKNLGCVVTFLSAFAFTFNAVGQTEQGKIVASGATNLSANFGSSKSEYNGNKNAENKTTSFGLEFSGAYFIIDNLAMGIFLLEDYYSTKNTEGVNDYKNSTNTFIIGPMIRYYLGVGAFKPFGQFEIGAGSSKAKEVIGSDTEQTKDKIFAWALSVGTAYFVAENISLDTILGYGSAKLTDGNDSNASVKAGGFDISIGVSIFF